MIPRIRQTLQSTARHKLVIALVGAAVVFGMAAVVRAATAPDFGLVAQPTSQTINSGSSAGYLVTVTPTNSFAGTVTLTAGTLPKGTSATWTVNGTTTSSASASVTVPAGSRGVSATLTIGGGQPTAGTYNPVVTAQSGALGHTATLTMVVVNQNAANFGLSVTPGAQSVVQGGTANSTVSISRTSGAGAVTFASPPVSGLPSGATASITPNPDSGSTAALSVSTSAGTPPGLYTLTLTGSAVLSGNSSSPRYASFTLVVQGATTTTMSAPATDATNSAIAPAALTATLSNGTSDASGTITFKVFGPQATAPTTCTSGGVTLGTATVNGSGTFHPSVGYTPTSAGSYWWYASYGGDSYNNASASTCGSGMASTVVKNTTTTGMSAPATAPATAQLTLSSALGGGTTSPAVSGTITFYAYGPSSTAPTTCPGSSTPWTTVGTATVSGNGTNYNAKFTPSVGGKYWWYASYGGDTLNSASNSTCGSAMASTAVQDFTLSASPSTQTALTNGTTADDSPTYSITVNDLGGFAGSVSLSLLNAPAGVTPTFTPTPTTTSSSLGLSVAPTAKAGNYPVTVQGVATVSGTTITRTAQITLVINPSYPFTISGDVPNPMYPGAAAQSFQVTLTNPNSFAITVKSLGSVVIQPVNAPNCQGSWFKVTLASVPSNGIVIAANGGTATVSAAAQMLDVKTSQDACKGKQLTLTYSGSYTK